MLLVWWSYGLDRGTEAALMSGGCSARARACLEICMGPGNCAHIRRCSPLWVFLNESFFSSLSGWAVMFLVLCWS